MAYAEDTKVSVEKTQADVRALLRRYRADRFMFGEDGNAAMVSFEMQNRRIMFRLPLPSPEEKRFTETDSGKVRASNVAEAAWEQACRARWRALLLCIKAKLESVESNIESFEDAFLAQIVTWDGSTIGERLRPELDAVTKVSGMQPLLPPPTTLREE